MTPRSQWSPAIGPAFFASLVIHAALAFALIGVMSTAAPALGDGASLLAVRLVEPPPSPPISVTEVDAATLAAAESPTKVPSPPPSPPPSESVSKAAPQPDPPQPAPTEAAFSAPSLPLGQVDVGESRFGLAILDQELVLRTQSEYPAEVDKAVRVVRKPDVSYPADAFAAQRSGTVIAWLAVNREGGVDEVIIVSGEPEFAEAVTAAIPTARFQPAEDGGATIRYYFVMEFEFRSGSTMATPAATANPADAPR